LCWYGAAALRSTPPVPCCLTPVLNCSAGGKAYENP
jgi:hypothetical protein